MAIVYNQLTIENQNFIVERAKTKNDGCYKIRGIAYRVVDGRVTHFGVNGKILEPHGAFNVSVGTCGLYDYEALKFLKEIK